MIKKSRKHNFFKWQLPFLTPDINGKFNFKATFINIVCAYFLPFWLNFYFLNNFFFEFLFKNPFARSTALLNVCNQRAYENK
jgi:hypothetical protein